jgi:hypothetical protein
VSIRPAARTLKTAVVGSTVILLLEWLFSGKPPSLTIVAVSVPVYVLGIITARLVWPRKKDDTSGPGDANS